MIFFIKNMLKVLNKRVKRLVKKLSGKREVLKKYENWTQNIGRKMK